MTERPTQKPEIAHVALRCRLFGHTTEPQVSGRWYATWLCSRCGTDLRTRPEGRG